jgi:glycosyltransferase involved in cell wall biosynthesis
MSSTARPGRPLRLTLVTETFPPEVNGVARTLGRWVEAFRARGHRVQVIRPRRPGEAKQPGRVPGLALPFYPQVRVGIASPARLRSLLDHGRPDLVHVATEGPLGWAAVLAAGGLGLPVASSFHTNYDHYLSHYGLGALDRLLTAYLRWFHNRTAATLAPSEATRRRLTADGFRRVAIWSRGVDGDLFHPRRRDESLRRALGLGPDHVLLLYVGRLAAEKNLPALLAAFARLRERLPASMANRVRLAVVGDGPLAAALRATPAPGAFLPGAKYGEDLARWYASADVFAFPSLSETFGNVVLEAQASGLPVVGYDCQGVSERVRHGIDGFLARPDGDLTDGLLRLSADAPLRRRFGAAAREAAARQDWKTIFDDLEERYYALAARPPQPTLARPAAWPFAAAWRSAAP